MVDISSQRSQVWIYIYISFIVKSERGCYYDLKTIFIYISLNNMDNQKWTQYFPHWRVWLNCEGSPCHITYEVQFFCLCQNIIPQHSKLDPTHSCSCRFEFTILQNHPSPFPTFHSLFVFVILLLSSASGASYTHSHFGIRHFSFSISLLASNTSKF